MNKKVIVSLVSLAVAGVAATVSLVKASKKKASKEVDDETAPVLEEEEKEMEEEVKEDSSNKCHKLWAFTEDEIIVSDKDKEETDEEVKEERPYNKNMVFPGFPRKGHKAWAFLNEEEITDVWDKCVEIYYTNLESEPKKSEVIEYKMNDFSRYMKSLLYSELCGISVERAERFFDRKYCELKNYVFMLYNK